MRWLSSSPLTRITSTTSSTHLHLCCAAASSTAASAQSPLRLIVCLGSFFSTSVMGRLMKVYLDTRDLYRCVQWSAHLSHNALTALHPLKRGAHHRPAADRLRLRPPSLACSHSHLAYTTDLEATVSPWRTPPLPAPPQPPAHFLTPRLCWTCADLSLGHSPRLPLHLRVSARPLHSSPASLPLISQLTPLLLPPPLSVCSVNVYTAPKVDRPLTTGLHTVSDLYCGGCDVEVGWFYNFAYEQSQKYKENKFILIENRIVQDDKPPSAQPHTASPSSSSSSSASSLRHSHLPHTPSSHSSHSSHFSSSDPHPSLALVGMEDDDEEDEEDEDGEEEEEEGLSTASVGHGHHLPPVSWTELTAIVGAELTGEGGRRRAIPPAEMRVRMRSARSAHSGHM